ncbi:maleylpyruvate isomerase family mycothiol-dependent enzyme [Blastococcus mobilis]|uniref:Maleylpyruvate isomerase n=1 Tax=Blastococcus mobilis TaxID=1938746 RepID=A0A238V574_9ACTN|nr:maleylpyruvate isomerase family mycothiol-dependent enzyme [Blastococcus mobilis]SNR29632.1 maleylpyruvate isomerase [Blastococcus mobilis]
MDEGTSVFLDSLARIEDDALAGPTALPGWTGRHLVAHVAANAEALVNLAHWAATGEETPMYSSRGQRNADIEDGSRRPPDELRRWAAASSERLSSVLRALTDEQWSRRVRTAQGREVAATEIPWLRAREVMVHALDLDPTLTFDDLPEGFVLALVHDIVARRSNGEQPALALAADGGRHVWSMPGRDQPIEVHGSLDGVAAYLAGRPGADVTSPTGAVPDLPPWL